MAKSSTLFSPLVIFGIMFEYAEDYYRICGLARGKCGRCSVTSRSGSDLGRPQIAQLREAVSVHRSHPNLTSTAGHPLWMVTGDCKTGLPLPHNTDLNMSKG